jgi:hypothetical protein
MIYEGREIINQLRIRSYYESFLAKVVFIDYIKIPNYRGCEWHPYGDDESKLFSSIPTKSRLDDKFNPEIILGDVYIVSIYNRFHSQLLMPDILMVNFNCTKKKMIEFWDVKQSGWYTNRDNLTYDENGNVEPES